MRIVMSGKVAVGIIAGAMICAALSAPAIAQEKVWKHGLINAKSDAGIFLMVSTRDFAKKQGLTIEISQFKDDQLALKALIAGELDSFEGGPQGVFAADSKGGDVKLLGCHWVVVPHDEHPAVDVAEIEPVRPLRIDVGIVRAIAFVERMTRRRGNVVGGARSRHPPAADLDRFRRVAHVDAAVELIVIRVTWLEVG